jgi:Tfp pilus assembly protein PilX
VNRTVNGTDTDTVTSSETTIPGRKFGANVALGAMRAPNFGRAPTRGRGERGAGLVVGIALIFAFTFLGLVWLARDVDRGVSNRSAAQSIAFQAARSGAQSASITDLRSGIIVIDPAAASRAATSTAGALFTSYGVEGDVTSVEVADDSVSVTVTITDAGRTVTGAGTVRAERAP